MNYQVGSACYGTQEQAAQASASSMVGAVVQHGGSAYAVNASSASATAIEYSLSPVGGGTAITISAPYSAQPCGLLTSSDALQMGWMLMAVWVGVYALMFLARALRGETGGEYGNT